jgi:hypothetical protein
MRNTHDPRTCTMNRRLASLFCLLALSAWPAWSQDKPQTQLPRVALSAGMHLINAQVAATPEQRAIGLMHRREMPTNEGMLFAFEQAGVQCFWMKNTLLPLTAAFVADDGTIVNLADMKPQSLDSHCSAQPVRFVLEMNQGWFAKRGLQAGSKLGGAPFNRPK